MNVIEDVSRYERFFKEVDENVWEEGSHITKEEHNEIKKSEEI